MDAQAAHAVAKRLAAYSAAAGVTLAIPAQGQVVYHDFDPDLAPHTLADCTVTLDLDDDGTDDFRITDRRGCENRYYYEEWVLGVVPGGDTRNAVICTEGTFGTASHAVRLGIGQVVGPGGQYQEGCAEALLAATFAACDYFYGQFVDAEGYAGFRFVAGDGRQHYGWIRLATMDCPIEVAVYEYAYALSPNAPAVTGVYSDALLTGALDQTTFPPEGGTLRYTFTAENITDQPLSLDLWLEATLSGGDPRTRRIGSGTLPPFARVTRTVSLPVPPGAPPGIYDVRFRLGDFATRQFVTFERYAVTKEAGAADSIETVEAFASAPFAGDVFAGPDALSTVVGTHALSAPVPNPTEGRVALTLQVAETQHLAVTVQDALGRQVAVLHDGPLPADAQHGLAFDGASLPNGVYVVRAVGEAFTDVRVFTLMSSR